MTIANILLYHLGKSFILEVPPQKAPLEPFWRQYWT